MPVLAFSRSSKLSELCKVLDWLRTCWELPTGAIALCVSFSSSAASTFPFISALQVPPFTAVEVVIGVDFLS